MDIRERFLQIRSFLEPYQKIWQNEIMLMYPAPLAEYPFDWIEEIRSFQSKNDIIKLEKKDVFSLLKSTALVDFYHRIEALCQIQRAQPLPPVPEDPFTWLFMIPKKQHEIKNLAPYLNHICRREKIDHLIDIGGGIGLLAQTLNNYYGLKVTSLDMNSEFQKTGSLRHEKNAKDPRNKVIYKNMKVERSHEFSSLLKGNVIPVGLHTCGKLALDIIRVSSQMKVRGLVNFGCCYHTLASDPALQNISEFAQREGGLRMNQFALTLACRAHRKMTVKDYDLKLKVKLYRYAIHILLHEHYALREFIPLGNSAPWIYDLSFGEYVLEQFQRINLTPKHSSKELDVFFTDPELRLLIDRMLAAGVIRNALGRVLELYLLLDRAIYLEEQGYQVKVEEFFDEEISPRNIGITALKEKTSDSTK